MAGTHVLSARRTGDHEWFPYYKRNSYQLRGGSERKMLVLFETDLRSCGDVPVYSDSACNTYIIRNDIAFPIDRDVLPRLQLVNDGTPQLEYSISESLLKEEGIYFQKGKLVKPVPACIKNILSEVSVEL